MPGRVRLPTAREDWRLVARTVRLVVSVPTYALLAAVVWVASLSVFVFAQNLQLVGFAVTRPLPLVDRLGLLVQLYPFVGTAYGALAGTVLVVVAALVGVDVALAGYHLREHGVSTAQGGGSAVGVLLGTLGAGCAACGTAIIAGLLSLFGAAGALTLLPLEGLELSLLAAGILVLSIYWLADGMRGGEIAGCPVDP